MKKTQKIIASLIVICLASLIIIQTYYARNEYASQKIEFVKDINRSLEIAVTKAEEAKADSILKLLGRDIKDTSLVQFNFRIDSVDGGRLDVIDPKSNGISISFISGQQAKTEDEMYAKILETWRRYVFDGIGKVESDLPTMVVWNDPIMDRISFYKDSMHLNQISLNSNFSKELRLRSIKNNFILLTTGLDSNTISRKENTVYSREVEWKTNMQNNAYVAEFQNPFFTILSRSALLIGSSVLVIILLIFSFILLMRILSKQKKLSSMKDDFMDNISHEMLTPISTLSVALESLKTFDLSKDEAKFEKYLNIANLELERMSALFHNVLMTSTFENRNVKLNIKETDIIEVLQNLKSYHTERSEKEVSIEISGPNSMLLKTDKDQFINCLNNLMDNAIKYCLHPKIELRVLVSDTTDSCSIEIADNGPGIKELEQKKIFEKFYRAHSGNEKGLGIGLYYVKTMLEQMNGSIILKSSSKNGSCFLIELNK